MSIVEPVNMKRDCVDIVNGVVYVDKILVKALLVDEDPTPSENWDDPVYALSYRPMKGVRQVFRGLNEDELIERILDLAKGEPKKPYAVYSLIAKVYGKEGVIVADYFETPDYLRALEEFDDMIAVARANGYGFAGMCDVVLTETRYDANGKVVKSNQFKAHVHGREGQR